MPYTPNSIVAQLFTFSDFRFTYAISGTVVAADVGKAVALDTTVANTVKLAADGDTVFGRLEVFEDRLQDGLKVATISRKIRAKLPVKTGLSALNVPALGDTVVGAGDGEVKSKNNGTTRQPDLTDNTVIELGTGYVVVEKL